MTNHAKPLSSDCTCRRAALFAASALFVVLALPGLGIAQAPAQDSAPPAGATALTVYQNYDFTPGNTILFADDFSETQDGEFPDRWELKSGQAVTNTNNGKPAFYLIGGNYAKVAPRIKTPDYLTDQYTIEFDWLRVNSAYGIMVFFETGGHDGYMSFQDPTVEFKGDDAHHFSTNLPDALHGNGFRNVWHHVAIAVKGSQAKFYIDQFRVLVVPDMGIVPKSIQLGGIASQNAPLIFTNFRLAYGGGMNMIGEKFTDAKIVTHGINFDVDKATIRPESMGTLNQVKRILTQNPDLKFEIDGHTDNTGTAAHNIVLSEQRANAVKAQLVAMGIDGSRLSAKGFGDTKPIAPNSTAEGKANNRRVEFVRMK